MTQNSKLKTQNYLGLLWRHDKFLFGIVVFFVLGQLFFSYKQVETTPFFNYGMYSEPCLEKEIYSTVSVYDKEGKKVSLQGCSKPAFFLQYQLNFYAKLLAQDSIDLVQNTIISRFGEGTNLTWYLTATLSNHRVSLNKFPGIFNRWVGEFDLNYKQENFKWVNNHFKLVNMNNI